MVLPFEIITKSAEETQNIGAAFGSTNVGNIVCLWGELGSGKTTFVQGFTKALHITDRIVSPTFIIVRRYDIPKKIGHVYHIDLYRIKNPEDAMAVGLSDMIHDSESITLIEWPERLGPLLPKSRCDVRFAVLPDGSHRITGSLV